MQPLHGGKIPVPRSRKPLHFLNEKYFWFLDFFYISQGSTATHLRYGGIVSKRFITNLHGESTGERNISVHV